MIVSADKGFVFIHNPKCAGSSFRSTIKPFHDHQNIFWGISYEPFFKRHMDKAHLRLWELEELHPEIFEQLEKVKSLTFVRDPIARFLSAITEHFIQYRPNDLLMDQTPGARQYMIEQFVRQEITLERVKNDFRFVHFSPQSWFIKLGGQRKVRYLVPLAEDEPIDVAFELLGLSSATVPTLNAKMGSRGNIHFSDFLREFAMKFYSQDYQLFESEPSLARAMRLNENITRTMQSPEHRRPERISPYLRHQLKRGRRRLDHIRRHLAAIPFPTKPISLTASWLQRAPQYTTS